MILYQLSHKHKLDDHCENKDIGIYSSRNKAESAIIDLKEKSGFKDTSDGFNIKKVFRFFKPKLLDKTFWIEGFDTYTYTQKG